MNGMADHMAGRAAGVRSAATEGSAAAAAATASAVAAHGSAAVLRGGGVDASARPYASGGGGGVVGGEGGGGGGGRGGGEDDGEAGCHVCFQPGKDVVIPPPAGSIDVPSCAQLQATPDVVRRVGSGSASGSASASGSGSASGRGRGSGIGSGSGSGNARAGARGSARGSATEGGDDDGGRRDTLFFWAGRVVPRGHAANPRYARAPNVRVELLRALPGALNASFLPPAAAAAVTATAATTASSSSTTFTATSASSATTASSTTASSFSSSVPSSSSAPTPLATRFVVADSARLATPLDAGGWMARQHGQSRATTVSSDCVRRREAALRTRGGEGHGRSDHRRKRWRFSQRRPGRRVRCV